MESITIDFSFRGDESVYDVFGNLLSINILSILEIKYVLNHEIIEVNTYSEISSLNFTEIICTIEKGEIWIQKRNNMLPRICFYMIDPNYLTDIVQFLENNYLNSICFGRIHEGIDELLQNVETPDSWRRKKRQLPNYVELFPNPIYTNEREKELVNLESLPGHSHQTNYGEMLWFGSCWQMYFSPIYYKYIPKFLFDDFQNCFEHKVFKNGLRKITLFENLEDFDFPVNRARQWAFRKDLGIDSIAHELTKQNNRIEPKNLCIIISKQNCTKGTTRVEIKKGIEITVKEFLDDGVTLVLEEIKTR